MRLSRLDHGHSWYVRAFFGAARLIMRVDPPDIMKTLYYRPGFFGLRFSHSLSSLRTEPSAQTILVHWAPSALKPCSQTSGQTRACFCLIASSASALAVLVSNLVPA